MNMNQKAPTATDAFLMLRQALSSQHDPATRKRQSAKLLVNCALIELTSQIALESAIQLEIKQA
ncbi:MAG: hypothetical protein V4772_01525, partial [Pseudomonadota bacterium]